MPSFPTIIQKTVEVLRLSVPPSYRTMDPLMLPFETSRTKLCDRIVPALTEQLELDPMNDNVALGPLGRQGEER